MATRRPTRGPRRTSGPTACVAWPNCCCLSKRCVSSARAASPRFDGVRRRGLTTGWSSPFSTAVRASLGFVTLKLWAAPISPITVMWWSSLGYVRVRAAHSPCRSRIPTRPRRSPPPARLAPWFKEGILRTVVSGSCTSTTCRANPATVRRDRFVRERTAQSGCPRPATDSRS